MATSNTQIVNLTRHSPHALINAITPKPALEETVPVVELIETYATNRFWRHAIKRLYPGRRGFAVLISRDRFCYDPTMSLAVFDTFNCAFQVIALISAPESSSKW
jgi:hypothetical protein